MQAIMKKILLMVVATMMATVMVKAQTSLVGREYHCANILAGEMVDFKKQVAEAKTQAIAKKEKEKGRKLTTEERQAIDAEVSKMHAKLKTITDGTKMSMTVIFKSATVMTLNGKMSMSDEAMKAAGVGWLKRKTMKAAMALSPSEDVNYTLKNNLVIFTDDGERDTFRISADGKQLYGVQRGNKKEKEKDMKFTLTRRK
jgi:hypothetical protein